MSFYGRRWGPFPSVKRRRIDSDIFIEEDDYDLPKEPAFEMQMQRYEIFKAQDTENGHFDVTFEVEGKKLHAHIFILTSVSDYMNAMLSARWRTKDETIKVKSYSYDNFYQFLCFLYIGKCDLNVENVYQLIDMAEFYGIKCLRVVCERYLRNPIVAGKIITVENIEEMFEFCEKYSLFGFLGVIKKFISNNQANVLEAENFIHFKKELVEFLNPLFNKFKELHYKTVYQWAEHRVRQQENMTEGNIREAIKNEYGTLLPNIELSKMSYDFLFNFAAEKGILSSADLCQYFLNNKNGETIVLCQSLKSLEQIKFEKVFALAEKQGLRKQMFNSNDENFNLNESIKVDLAELLLHIKFYRISKKCIMDALVAKGIFTEEEVIGFYNTRIEIKNGNELFTGAFNDQIQIRYTFEKAGYCGSFTRKLKRIEKLRFCNVKVEIPLIESTLKKQIGVQWYLCLENDGVLCLKHQKLLANDDYLICEMKSRDNCKLTSATGTCIKFSDYV